MRYNLSRHLLLKKLSEKYIAHKDDNGDGADRIGLKLQEIDEILGTRKGDRDLIISELGNSKEIHAFDINGKGFFITPSEGLSALSEKKYLNRNKEIIRSWLKDFVQIFVPIASLTIAILALWIRMGTLNKEHVNDIEKLNSRLEILENSKKDKGNELKTQTMDLEVDSLR
ncbi:hypothetical protein [Maribacter sp. R77961]|uniref:hypothetical protein n=1 Tax=Maribacter sp. R77961 TaxID=3093871 RepID=UPI0037CADD7B